MKYILYPQQNNKLTIIAPCTDIDNAISKCVPQGVPYKVIDTIDIHDKFFDAYEFDAEAGFVVNIEKAKEIKHNQFRQARKPLLEQLDIEYIRAVETSNTSKKKAIAAAKQELRDLPAIQLPNNIDDLASFWPAILAR